MLSSLIKRTLECCDLRGNMGYLDVDNEYAFQEDHEIGFDSLNNLRLSSYYSFKPNNSIRYLTNNLHQRFGTDQLSMLPKFDVNKLMNSDEANAASTYSTKDGFKMGIELYRFIVMLSRGFMVKQIVDFGSGDVRYMSVCLSNNKSLTFDNFSGIILEVPLRSIIDVLQGEIVDENKTGIEDFSIRKGYEPIKANSDTLFIVSIEMGNNTKSICLAFNSEDDSLSFCSNLKGLIRYYSCRL